MPDGPLGLNTAFILPYSYYKYIRQLSIRSINNFTVLVLIPFTDLFVETTMENRNTFKDITTMKEFWMVS